MDFSRWCSSLILMPLYTPNFVSLKCSIFKWFIRITSSILVGRLIMTYANPLAHRTFHYFGGYRMRAYFAVCPWYLCAVEACATVNGSCHRGIYLSFRTCYRNIFRKNCKKKYRLFLLRKLIFDPKSKKIDSWPKVEQILIFRRNRKKISMFCYGNRFLPPKSEKNRFFGQKIETIDYYYFALEIDFWPQNRKKIYFWHQNR